MAYQYIDGEYSVEWLPSGAKVNRKIKARLCYEVIETDTQVTISAKTQYTIWKDNCQLTLYSRLQIGEYAQVQKEYSTPYSSSGSNHTEVYHDFGGDGSISTLQSYTYSKTDEAQSIPITLSLVHKANTSHYSNVSVTITIPAIYTVTLNVNNGTGLDHTTLTKKQGIPLPVYETNNIPQRNNYTFLGWGTSATSASATYTSSNPDYVTDEATTLYAIWQLNYVSPTITDVSCYRVASNRDYDYTPTDNGGYIYIGFNYTGGKGSNGYIAPRVTITIDGTPVITNEQQSAISGPYEKRLGGSYDANNSHTVVIKLDDASHTSYATIYTTSVAAGIFPIDLYPVTIDNTTHVYMGLMAPAESGVPLKAPSLKIQTDNSDEIYLQINSKTTTAGTGAYIDYNGNTYTSGNITAASNSSTIKLGLATTDPLYIAIDSLGWVNDVIVSS